MCHKEEHIHHQNSKVQCVSVPNLRPASVSENYFDRHTLKGKKKTCVCFISESFVDLKLLRSYEDFTNS